MSKPEFTKRCPNVEVNILETTDAKIESKIVKGSVDIGITAMPILSPDIDYVELAKEQIVICVPATHSLRIGKDLSNNSITNPLLLQAS